LDSAFQTQFALLCTELLQLVADRIEEVSHPLREQAETIKFLLARVGSLEHMDLFSSKSTKYELYVVIADDVVSKMLLLMKPLLERLYRSCLWLERSATLVVSPLMLGHAYVIAAPCVGCL
jgi:hypothetical protein